MTDPFTLHALDATDLVVIVKNHAFLFILVEGFLPGRR
jgi:hypothetical protein